VFAGDFAVFGRFFWIFVCVWGWYNTVSCVFCSRVGICGDCGVGFVGGLAGFCGIWGVVLFCCFVWLPFCGVWVMWFRLWFACVCVKLAV